MSSKAVLAKGKEIVFEVSSTEQLGNYFDSIGYNVAANPDILKAIPRFRFTHIPKNWEEDTSVPLKKSVFFVPGRPLSFRSMNRLSTTVKGCRI